MSQTASFPPNKESKAYKAMLSKMGNYKAILEGMGYQLRPMNLNNIDKTEIEKYKAIIDGITSYVMDKNNSPLIYNFVNPIQEFCDLCDLIIIKFNNALKIWERYIQSDVNSSKYKDGELDFEKRLLDCRSEISKLVTKFKGL